MALALLGARAMRTFLSVMLLSGIAGAAEKSPTDAASAVQAVVDEEVAALAREASTQLVMVAVLAPDGSVLASGGQRGSKVDRSLPMNERRDPGSVMKTFTIGAALEAGVVTASTHVSGAHGHAMVLGREVNDVVPHDDLSLDDVMAFSSNIGTAQVFTRLGHERLAKTLQELGIPARKFESDADALGASYGADVMPTPVELGKAFAAIASRRVFRTQGAVLSELLAHSVERDDGTGRGARVPGMRVAGKTGTWKIAEGLSYADFVGFGPLEAPRYIVVVGVETRASGYSGGTIAAPAFARVMQKLRRLRSSTAWHDELF